MNGRTHPNPTIGETCTMQSAIELPIRLSVLKALARHIAPSDDNRHYMNGVAVEYDNAGVTCVATDGSMLAAWHEPFETTDYENLEGRRTIILPRELCKSLAPVHVKADRALLTIPKDQQTITIGPLKNTDTATALTIEGRFPEWRKLIPPSIDPKRDKEKHTIAHLNPRFHYAIECAYADIMEAEAKALAARPAAAKAQDTLTMLTLRGNAPAVAQGTDKRFIAIIMPRRMDRLGDVPGWVHTTGKAPAPDTAPPAAPAPAPTEQPTNPEPVAA